MCNQLRTPWLHIGKQGIKVTYEFTQIEYNSFKKQLQKSREKSFFIQLTRIQKNILFSLKVKLFIT